MPRRQLTVGVGAAAHTASDLVLDLGPQHPSAHGMLQVHLVLDGDTVVAADPRIGFMHRGAEKLFEVRDYRQIMVLANRHDWLAAFPNELGVALAVERALGMELPPRAVWLRTLLCELNRVLSALAFLGAGPLERPGAPPVLSTHDEREALQAVLEEASGGRVHYVLNRVGGLTQDVPAGWVQRCRTAVGTVRGRVDDLRAALHDPTAAAASARGAGVLSRRAALDHGVSGPVGRASGVDLDLRRDDPYLAYAELGFGTRFPVVTATAGDAWARLSCLLEQVPVSLDLVDACLDGLPGGAVGVRLPKVVRAPHGTSYTWTENPPGVTGWYLVSRGDRTPHRLRLRTPSFATLSALPALLPGTRLDQLVAVLASLFFVVGDVDR